MDAEKQSDQESAKKLGSTVTRAGLDTATGGAWNLARRVPGVRRVAKGVENKAGNAFANSHLGKRTAGVARKLDNSGALDTANKAMDLKSGKKPSKNEQTQKRLQNSLSKRVSNTFNSRNKRKKDNKEGNENQEPTNNTKPTTESNDATEGAKKKVKRKVILSIMAIALPIFGFFLLIILFVALIGTIFPFLIPGGLSRNEIANLTTESGFTQEEIDYYQKLSSVSKKYEEKCDDELDINYIHSALIYYYYQVEEDISYNRMKNNVDMVYNAIPSHCGVDYSVDGEFYDNLKNSRSFRSYYSKLLVDRSIDDILTEIFDLSNEISIANDVPDDFFIPEDTKVSVNNDGIKSNGNTGGSSSSGGNSSGSSSGNSQGGGSSSGNNSSGSTNLPTSVSFKDYILGIVYANILTEDLNNTEKLKALVVLHTTNALAKGNLSINALTISINDNSNDLLYCNPDYGCSFASQNGKLTLQVGGGEAGSGNNTFYAGKYYYKLPIDSTIKANLTKIVNEMYGYVLVTSDNKFNVVDVNKINSIKIDKYSDALKSAYPDLVLKNIRENVYDHGVNFGNKKVSTPVIAYDQNDYGNTIFCGRTKPKATIKTSGCGVTAMAIIVSSYENSKKYDPVYEMNKAYKWGYCGYGISGTAIAFFQKEAKAMGYKYLKVGKSKTSDKNLVLSHLTDGDLVIVHMGPGKFTSGGHYMVVSGIDPDTKKVYITDPYNKANKANPNRKSGNGWYSFNDIIAKQAYAFYIIWKG